MVKRGEVRWYKFSKPDKRRPVLVLTRNSHLEYLNEVTVAPLTSSIRDIPSQVVLTKSEGLPRDCAISLDHIRTVDKTHLGAQLTTLSHSRMQEVRSAILYALGY